ncbi:Na(+)/H(+) antiporter subunit C [Gulosibacter macacae]|uniref:Na(+)/H(+) antiporter subunit C n=1 Tax=Gulosibacter macacae TaxID=2488791 RepID=A0A3P3W6Q4_9MICO|nr:Na(+)/H(+) antiporter subunit C [Gulosibacter macacae]RRJ88343.1 Na(+)/H(+) antiporter subunit C [Gulosibacter macacae]
MTVDLALIIGMVVLYAAGIYQLLERSFTRMIFGFMLVGNATNLLIFITAGMPGLAPLRTEGAAPEDYTDPLPQAFILTAIVITFATTSFMLALLYRSWRLARVDTVADDHEDIALRTVDPEADDEVFEPDDSGDTEFGPEFEASLGDDDLDDEMVVRT